MNDVQTKSPFVLVIFGATGDLAHHKLIPALFNLYKEHKLPQDFFIVGFARRPFSQEEFANSFVQFSDEKEWLSFATHLYYQQGTFGEMGGYTKLIDMLAGFDKMIGSCVARIFYLATPPEHYHNILHFLQSSKLSLGCLIHNAINSKQDEGQAFTRIAIEKPFGKDLETAKALDRRLAQIFEEKQIFRVDHYLGKETVQNLLIFRFANGIFDPIWNNEFIDH
ncbi:MAG: glucose-6-phosphate dehydrogenase, partial [Patescibacteria group bacterium]|nr:glucose-6-phosphate dehydrogenase [Patescibacteria group bacterium]